MTHSSGSFPISAALAREARAKRLMGFAAMFLRGDDASALADFLAGRSSSSLASAFEELRQEFGAGPDAVITAAEQISGSAGPDGVLTLALIGMVRAANPTTSEGSTEPDEVQIGELAKALQMFVGVPEVDEATVAGLAPRGAVNETGRNTVHMTAADIIITKLLTTAVGGGGGGDLRMLPAGSED